MTDLCPSSPTCHYQQQKKDIHVSLKPTLVSSSARTQFALGNAEASYRGIQMGKHRERINSSIQEMTAGPNTILNRTRGYSGNKSIAGSNDDHHLGQIFRVHRGFGCMAFLRQTHSQDNSLILYGSHLYNSRALKATLELAIKCIWRRLTQYWTQVIWKVRK